VRPGLAWRADIEIHDFFALLAVLIGLGGIVLPILPGLALQVVAIVLWAFEESSPGGWVVALLCTGVAVTATILKYARPRRRMKEAGVPTWVLALAVGVGIVGFFVVPVIGGPLGFVLAIYVFERVRAGRTRAWPSTKEALVAIAQSMGIELAGGVLILVIFTGGALMT